MALRRGRLSNEERLEILLELGERARKKYNQNLFFGSRGYDLRLLMDALQYAPDVEQFENIYWVDTGSEKLNDIANYFEYGTGLYNVKRKSNAKPIKPTNKKVMKFKGKDGKIAFAQEVAGVKPIMMFQKTMVSMANERKFLQRKLRIELGI